MIPMFTIEAPAIGVNGASVTPAPLRLAFERFDRELDDYTEVFDAVLEQLEKAEARQFASEGSGPIAGRWAALTDNPPGHGYASRKLAEYGPKPILQASGTLRDALTTGGAYSLRETGPKQMAFGTRGVEHASYHQTGTPKMVARPPIDLDRAARTAIGRAAAEKVRQAWLRSGLSPYTSLRGSAYERVMDDELDRAMERAE